MKPFSVLLQQESLQDIIRANMSQLYEYHTIKHIANINMSS